MKFMFENVVLNYLLMDRPSYKSMIESNGKPYVIDIRIVNNLWIKRDYLLSIFRAMCDLS